MGASACHSVIPNPARPWSCTAVLKGQRDYRHETADEFIWTQAFTVFAPTNEAFAALPSGTVDTLLMPQNKAMLTKILTCRVVAGDISSMTLSKWIDTHHGHYTLTTLGGCKLIATKSDGKIMLTDEKGGMANITIADVNQSNGVIHVVDKVLLPAG